MSRLEFLLWCFALGLSTVWWFHATETNNIHVRTNHDHNSLPQGLAPVPKSNNVGKQVIKRGKAFIHRGDLVPNKGSPPQAYNHAYVSLCVGDSIIYGSLVLFQSLRKTGAKADFVALTYNLSDANLARLHSLGVRTYTVSPIKLETYLMPKGESMTRRDGILWSKLRVWQLEDYDKVIMLDADLFVLRNVDELFTLPELSGASMMDTKEKILFFKSSEYGLRIRNKLDRKNEKVLLEGWSGLNSGVTVVEPSNRTFTDMLSELTIIPNRPCCPSQEFLYNFFEERRRFFRLPQVYNTRTVSDEKLNSQLFRYAKIYHFVGAKPWKRRDNGRLNRLWWEYKEEVDRALASVSHQGK
ncbi:hypothetical protein HDU76_001496 [Blyttiomyces sp. JEL0837]|nr:hypothetical protein HDU76_001496 [Blyttiomyces sp. JEL0837]